MNDAEGHRSRLRDRFRKAGLAGISDYELLELLLFYAIPRRDVKPAAKALLRRFGSLEEVFAADMEELVTVGGIGSNSALLLKLLPAIGVEIMSGERKTGIVLDSPEKIAVVLRRHFADRREEALAVLLTDDRMSLLDAVDVPGGTGNLGSDSLNMLYKVLCRRRARRAIIAHNHPSRLLKPSRSDIVNTIRIRDVLRRAGIALIDHYVVTPETCVSLMKRFIADE